MNYFLYHGMSMIPVFQESDLLEIIPIADVDLRPGDIIAFFPSINEELVVHRIVKIAPGGITTRGDNNFREDNDLVAYTDVLGRVEAFYREGKRKTLLRGTSALWQSSVQRRLQSLQLKKRIHTLLRPAYHFCAQRVNLASFMPPCFKTRIVIFRNKETVSLRLFLGNRPIGRYHAHRKHWSIQGHFRLLVDERKLPEIHQLERLFLHES